MADRLVDNLSAANRKASSLGIITTFVLQETDEFLMAQKGLTKKQFQIQMASMAIFVLLAVYWIVRGVFHESAVEWIIGALYCVLILANTIHLIIQRKRHPVDDPLLDEQAVDNFKTGLKGMGIVLAFIAFGFLIAIGLAAIMS